MGNKKLLKRGALMTDIHWGKKGNSEVHNLDCMNFIDWFIHEVQELGDIDYIGFLGDWHENRNALNIETLKHSFIGAKKLNDLGIPIYFIVGNHDLYHRHSRETHSLHHFDELNNFKVIEEPYVANEIEGGVVFSPFLFHDEYPDLKKFLDVPIWMGHFEFRGFVVTGYNVIMPTGPDIMDYQGPEYIFSGHFHKRQANNNVVYIGNTFPMDFGDAGDDQRGFTVYDHATQDVEFFNWEQCPKYTKTTLSNLLDNNVTLHQDSRVKCIVDVDVTYEESTVLKQTFMEKYQLREFTMEESGALAAALSDTNTTVDVGEEDLACVNELVIQMLNDIDNDQIDNDLLIDEYKKLA